MDSPSVARRQQFASQPKRQRTSSAPAPAARFGRSAAGQALNWGNSPHTDGPKLRKYESSGEFLPSMSGETRLIWNGRPQNVLVIKKYRDRGITTKFKEITRYLVEEHNLKVMVEGAVLAESLVCSDTRYSDIFQQLVSWTCEDEDCDQKLTEVDFIVCLGGDGTLLYVSSLFQDSVPPILAFRLGSLGFLTPLDVNDYKPIISKVMDGDATLTLRARLNCMINRRADSQPTSPFTNGTPSLPEAVSKLVQPSARGLSPGVGEKPYIRPLSPGVPGFVPPPVQRSNSVITRHTQTSHMLVLNEVVIDRGQSAYLSNLEIYCNGRLVTDVQGDGLIVATATGSTAYAAAAGASMVHPSVQAMVVTPICPHSLSFRPIMVPGGVRIEVKVPENGRGTGAVSCDGKNRQELSYGDSVQISMSIYPLPCVDGVDHISDWFSSLSSCLHWNVRTKQKAFDRHSEEEDAIGAVPEEGEEEQ